MPTEHFIWAMYFAQVAGMNLHPGHQKDETKRLTLEQCADMADNMLVITLERIHASRNR